MRSLVPRSRRRRAAVLVLGPGERVQATNFNTFMAVRNVRGLPRERRCFRTLSDAQEYLLRRRVEKASPLTSAQYASAQVAVALLPSGITIADAVRGYLALSGASGGRGGVVQSLRLSAATERFLAERAPLVSSVTASVYRRMLGRLAAALGDPLLPAISPQAISDWVAPLSPQARNKALRNVSPMFAWAVRHEMLLRNPCDAVERARGVEAPLGILPVADAERMLRGAAERRPELVAYLALGMFAGIRPAELARLTPDCIGAEFIRLDGRITKTASARTIRIRDNLRAWLAAYPPRWPLAGARTVRHLTALHNAIGVAWPSDCMRHSFATYAYEMSKDAAAVAAEMGHTGTAVFFKHYRALAEPGDGARFFGIEP
jgi:integrase